MYFEDEYNEIVKTKINHFISLYSGMFASREVMLALFNKHEDLSVTTKTFKKWLDACGFTVTECVVVHPPGDDIFATTSDTSNVDPIFDNETLVDTVPPNVKFNTWKEFLDSQEKE
jgi:hypothetical protein